MTPPSASGAAVSVTDSTAPAPLRTLTTTRGSAGGSYVIADVRRSVAASSDATTVRSSASDAASRTVRT